MYEGALTACMNTSFQFASPIGTANMITSAAIREGRINLSHASGRQRADPASKVPATDRSETEKRDSAPVDARPSCAIRTVIACLIGGMSSAAENLPHGLRGSEQREHLTRD